MLAFQPILPPSTYFVRPKQETCLGRPNFLAGVLSRHPIKNPIAAQNYEVVAVFLDVNMVYLRIDDYYVRVSIILFHFGLAVSECPGHRETARQDADWSLSCRPSRTSDHYIIVLVNLTSCLNDTDFFSFLRGFVVVGNRNELLPCVNRHDSS